MFSRTAVTWRSFWFTTEKNVTTAVCDPLADVHATRAVTPRTRRQLNERAIPGVLPRTLLIPVPPPVLSPVATLSSIRLMILHTVLEGSAGSTLAAARSEQIGWIDAAPLQQPAQLAQSRRLDLPDALACETEAPTDRL